MTALAFTVPNYNSAHILICNVYTSSLIALCCIVLYWRGGGDLLLPRKHSNLYQIHCAKLGIDIMSSSLGLLTIGCPRCPRSFTERYIRFSTTTGPSWTSNRGPAKPSVSLRRGLFWWLDISSSWWTGCSPPSRDLVHCYCHGPLMKALESWWLLRLSSRDQQPSPLVPEEDLLDF
jgi:hypothetical protein